MSFLNSTTWTGPHRTRPDLSAPATRSPTKSGPCQIPLHGPTDFVCDPTRPDQTHGQSPYMSRLSGQVYTTRQSLRGLVRDPSGPSVWSGRVRVVEFRNDATRPDQRQSNKCIAVRKVATPLRELTCHIGSPSVTCHPAELTFPPLPQPKLVLD